jgi:hypothetical protein
LTNIDRARLRRGSESHTKTKKKIVTRSCAHTHESRPCKVLKRNNDVLTVRV